MKPLVSVLIPCFNAAPYVAETLENVLGQSWPHLDVVVVDDGSTDDSASVVERFGPRVRLIRQENRGQTAALNTALGAARGDLIQYLDADDLISPDKIAAQAERLRLRPRAVVAGSWERFHVRSGDIANQGRWIDRDLASIDWVVENWCGEFGNMFPARWLLPRSVVEDAGPWREDLSLNNDGEYFTRVALTVDEVLYAPGAHAFYRSGVAGSLSGARSPVALASQFAVLDLCEGYIRARRDSAYFRRGFCTRWQDLAHASYPYDRGISAKAMARARALDSLRVTPGGGRGFHLARRLFGWRIARLMQVALGRP